MLLSVSLILVGLVALYYGAEWLVKGASSLAIRLGMSPLVAGLTVVAFGTSSPELVVSLTATLNGSGDIALGNVVGSNIFNIALILGLTAVIIPLKVEFQLIKFDAPFMLGATLLFLFFFRDAEIQKGEAVVLLTVLVAYIVLNLFLAKRKTTPVVDAEYEGELRELATEQKAKLWQILLLIALGLGVLVAGSHAFVKGAVDIARSFGVSEAVIGLTIVAAGTSLPELASSLVAAFRKQADIAIGNVIGSNLFNILGILGVSGLAAGPLTGPGITSVDLWVMTGVALVTLPILWTGARVSRLEGVMLLCCYAGYMVWIWPR